MLEQRVQELKDRSLSYKQRLREQSTVLDMQKVLIKQTDAAAKAVFDALHFYRYRTNIYYAQYCLRYIRARLYKNRQLNDLPSCCCAAIGYQHS